MVYVIVNELIVYLQLIAPLLAVSVALMTIVFVIAHLRRRYDLIDVFGSGYLDVIHGVAAVDHVEW